MELILVHSSDLHVDDGYTASLHGGDGVRGLRLVLETAKALAADAVLLAGDVFEHNRLPVALLAEAADLLAGAGRPVVILPGNHDPLTPDSAYRRGPFAAIETVHILGLAGEEHALLAELDLEVWGRPHREYADMAPLAEGRTRRTRWQVTMAHGHYEAPKVDDGRLRPSWLIGDDEIAATGADYVALGHWNQFAEVGPGHVPAFYSGAPETAETVNRIALDEDGGVSVTRTPVAAEVA